MPVGLESAVGTAYSFNGDPLIGKRPMRFVPGSVNQSASSGPLVIVSGCALPVSRYCVNMTKGLFWIDLTRQMELVPGSVNHILPSEPNVMPTGRAALSGSLYSTNGWPTTVICPTAARLVSVNHRFKSGGEPDAMPFGSAWRVGVTWSMM